MRRYAWLTSGDTRELVGVGVSSITLAEALAEALADAESDADALIDAERDAECDIDADACNSRAGARIGSVSSASCTSYTKSGGGDAVGLGIGLADRLADCDAIPAVTIAEYWPSGGARVSFGILEGKGDAENDVFTRRPASTGVGAGGGCTSTDVAPSRRAAAAGATALAAAAHQAPPTSRGGRVSEFSMESTGIPAMLDSVAPNGTGYMAVRFTETAV